LYYLPFGLIRLGGYSATQAGAALLPFALIMGLALRSRATRRPIRPRLSLTRRPPDRGLRIGAARIRRSREILLAGVFPAICVLAIGMTVTVPPLTQR